jgi:hypothetical protein
MQETDSAEATAGILVRVVNPKWKFRLSLEAAPGTAQFEGISAEKRGFPIKNQQICPENLDHR